MKRGTPVLIDNGMMKYVGIIAGEEYDGHIPVKTYDPVARDLMIRWEPEKLEPTVAAGGNTFKTKHHEYGTGDRRLIKYLKRSLT